MPQGSFSAQVDDWTRKSKERMESVFKDASQRVCEDVVRRTPVDTGFLRASFTASTSQMPQIDPKATGQGGVVSAGLPVSLVIAGASIGTTIYAGFSASYSAAVEYGTARMQPRRMVGLAAQAWPQHVAASVAAAKAAVESGR